MEQQKSNWTDEPTEIRNRLQRLPKAKPPSMPSDAFLEVYMANLPDQLWQKVQAMPAPSKVVAFSIRPYWAAASLALVLGVGIWLAKPLSTAPIYGLTNATVSLETPLTQTEVMSYLLANPEEFEEADILAMIEPEAMPTSIHAPKQVQQILPEEPLSQEMLDDILLEEISNDDLEELL